MDFISQPQRSDINVDVYRPRPWRIAEGTAVFDMSIISQPPLTPHHCENLQNSAPAASYWDSITVGSQTVQICSVVWQILLTCNIWKSFAGKTGEKSVLHPPVWLLRFSAPSTLIQAAWKYPANTAKWVTVRGLCCFKGFLMLTRNIVSTKTKKWIIESFHKN